MEYISIATLNGVFYDLNDRVESSTLLKLYEDAYISFKGFKYGSYPISQKNKTTAEKWAKENLREATDEGYLSMKLEGNTWFSTAQQKLFDSDEFPIGFKTRVAQLIT